MLFCSSVSRSAICSAYCLRQFYRKNGLPAARKQRRERERQRQDEAERTCISQTNTAVTSEANLVSTGEGAKLKVEERFWHQIEDKPSPTSSVVASTGEGTLGEQEGLATEESFRVQIDAAASAIKARVSEAVVQVQASACAFTFTITISPISAAKVQMHAERVEVGIQTSQACDTDPIEAGVQAELSEPLPHQPAYSDTGSQTEPLEPCENSNIDACTEVVAVQKNAEDERCAEAEGDSKLLAPTHACSNTGLQIQPDDRPNSNIDTSTEVVAAQRDAEDEICVEAEGDSKPFNHEIDACPEVPTAHRKDEEGGKSVEGEDDCEHSYGPHTSVVVQLGGEVEDEDGMAHRIGSSSGSGDEGVTETQNENPPQEAEALVENIYEPGLEPHPPATQSGSPQTDSLFNAFFDDVANLRTRVTWLECENDILRSQHIHCLGCNCKISEAPAGDGVEAEMKYDHTVASQSHLDGEAFVSASSAGYNVSQELPSQPQPITAQLQNHQEIAFPPQIPPTAPFDFNMGAFASGASSSPWDFNMYTQQQQPVMQLDGAWQIAQVEWNGKDAQASMHEPYHPQAESMISDVAPCQEQSQQPAGAMNTQDLGGDTDMERSHEISGGQSGNSSNSSVPSISKVDQARSSSPVSENIYGNARQCQPVSEDMSVDAHPPQENSESVDAGFYDIAGPHTLAQPTAAIPPTLDCTISSDDMYEWFGLAQSVTEVSSTSLPLAECDPPENPASYTLSDALGAAATGHTPVQFDGSPADNTSPPPAASSAIYEPSDSSESSTPESPDERFWKAVRRTWQHMSNVHKASIMVSFAGQNPDRPQPFFGKNFDWGAARETVERLSNTEPAWVCDFVTSIRAHADVEEKEDLEAGLSSCPSTMIYDDDTVSIGDDEYQPEPSSWQEFPDITTIDDYGDTSSSLTWMATDDDVHKENLAPSWTEPPFVAEPSPRELSSSVPDWANITAESSTSTVAESPPSQFSRDEWLDQEQMDEKLCWDASAGGWEDLPSQPQPM
jgi:hypothetical protein